MYTIGNVPATNKPGSWMVVNKETGKNVIELFDEKYVKLINTQKYEAVPIMEYLTRLNREVREGKHGEAAKGVYDL